MDETARIAVEWIKDLEATLSKPTCAVVVGLSGHLGAGKTAFVAAVARQLGVTGDVVSPTFVIMKQYATNHSLWSFLVHIDAYRLESPQELEAINWNALRADPKNLIMVEWPENVAIIPDQALALEQRQLPGRVSEVHIEVR